MTTSTDAAAAAAIAPSPAGGADAATYQRLRAHLAFLKLTAAAEALPTALDAARDTQLPVLDASNGCSGSRPPRSKPASSPPAPTSPHCPRRRHWTTTTTPPNPASTKR